MSDRIAFARLAQALSPWAHQLVYVGGWAHRLYRLHPRAQVPGYQPLATLDADVAVPNRDAMEGSIKSRLADAGFNEEFTGEHHPPVSQYTLGEEHGGFYAEFLTPLIGREYTREGMRLATVATSGITAQRLRYLDLLMHAPWQVELTPEWGATSPMVVRVPNPVSFIVQKLLIHDARAPDKRAQDLLYIHDTLELFAESLEVLHAIWRDEVEARMPATWVRRVMRAKQDMFDAMSDRLREAAVMAQGRNLDPERLRAMCAAALDEVLAAR